MATPTRFLNGISTRRKTHSMGDLPIPDSVTGLSQIFDDFFIYTAAEWTVTEDQGASTQAASTGANGELVLTTTTTTDNDLVSITSVRTPFRIRTGKKSWFATRVKLSDATNSDMVVGLAVADTSPIGDAAVTSIAAGNIVFFKADDAATLAFEVGTGGTSTKVATGIGTMVDDTYIDLAWVWDGATTISAYVDGAKVLDQTTLTNIPTSSELLGFIFSVNSGNATGTKVLTIDYMFSAQER